MSIINKINEMNKDRVNKVLRNEENFRKDTAVFNQMITLYQSLVDSLSLLNSHIAIDSDDFKDSINEQTKENIKSLIGLDLSSSNALNQAEKLSEGIDLNVLKPWVEKLTSKQDELSQKASSRKIAARISLALGIIGYVALYTAIATLSASNPLGFGVMIAGCVISPIGVCSYLHLGNSHERYQTEARTLTNKLNGLTNFFAPNIETTKQETIDAEPTNNLDCN